MHINSEDDPKLTGNGFPAKLEDTQGIFVATDKIIKSIRKSLFWILVGIVVLTIIPASVDYVKHVFKQKTVAKNKRITATAPSSAAPVKVVVEKGVAKSFSISNVISYDNDYEIFYRFDGVGEFKSQAPRTSIEAAGIEPKPRTVELMSKVTDIKVTLHHPQ